MNERMVLKTRRVVRKKKPRFWKGFLVVLFATALTTLAIHASDTLTIPGTSLFAGVGASAPRAHCPLEMTYVPQAGGGYCIDTYEVSTGDHCAFTHPGNETETGADMRDSLCAAVSVKARQPWVNVPFHDALAICAKGGKRLPTNKEWYRAALGTPDAVRDDGESDCALARTGQTNADNTGANPKCVSSYGAYDMVGNVWEWVDGSVESGSYAGKMLPDQGFVAGADVDGVPTETATDTVSAFGNDYFYIDKNGTRGMMRGGFWSLKEKAGLFTVNATIPTSFTGSALGFRCVKDAK